jgi:hypothetical protein
MSSYYQITSDTCGVQEALERGVDGVTIFYPPESICPGWSKPVLYSGEFAATILGVGAPNPALANVGSRVKPIGATEHTGNDVPVTITLDACTSFTLDITDIDDSSFRVTRAAGTCDMTMFEEGQYLSIDDLTTTGGGGNAADTGSYYPVLTVEDASNMVLGDPKGRITASNLGNASAKLWGTSISRGSGTWPAVEPIDVTGTAAGDIPHAFRASDDDGTFDCPWVNCAANDRRWHVLSRFASNTKLSLLDENARAITETATVDYTISWGTLFWTGPSVNGPEVAGALRGFAMKRIAFTGDEDGDGDGEVATALLFKPDNDHAVGQKNIVLEQLDFRRRHLLGLGLEPARPLHRPGWRGGSQFRARLLE